MSDTAKLPRRIRYVEQFRCEAIHDPGTFEESERVCEWTRTNAYCPKCGQRAVYESAAGRGEWFDACALCGWSHESECTSSGRIEQWKNDTGRGLNVAFRTGANKVRLDARNGRVTVIP